MKALVTLDEIDWRIRERGGRTFEISVPPRGGRCCTAGDPFGNRFDLIGANMKGDTRPL